MRRPFWPRLKRRRNGLHLNRTHEWAPHVWVAGHALKAPLKTVHDPEEGLHCHGTPPPRFNAQPASVGRFVLRMTNSLTELYAPVKPWPSHGRAPSPDRWPCDADEAGHRRRPSAVRRLRPSQQPRPVAKGGNLPGRFDDASGTPVTMAQMSGSVRRNTQAANIHIFCGQGCGER